MSNYAQNYGGYSLVVRGDTRSSSQTLTEITRLESINAQRQCINKFIFGGVPVSLGEPWIAKCRALPWGEGSPQAPLEKEEERILR